MRNSLLNNPNPTPHHKYLGKPLTKDLIFTKTRNDNLQNIKNLNLWGNDLQDLSLLNQMPNLQVISLSVNNIKTLKYFENSFKLQELYLRKNDIKMLQQIQYLSNLPQLRVLWLCDNPCSNIKNYRQIVLSMLPNLMKLDNDVISQEQRIKDKYRKRQSSEQQSRNVQKSNYYQGNNNHQRNLENNHSSKRQNQHQQKQQQRNSINNNNSKISQNHNYYDNKSLNQVNQNIQRSSINYQRQKEKHIKNNNFMIGLQQNKSQFHSNNNYNSKINSSIETDSTKIIQNSQRKPQSSPLKPNQNNNSSNYVNMNFQPYSNSDRKNQSYNQNITDSKRNRLVSQGQQSNSKNYQNSGRNQEYQQQQQYQQSHIQNSNKRNIAQQQNYSSINPKSQVFQNERFLKKPQKLQNNNQQKQAIMQNRISIQNSSHKNDIKSSQKSIITLNKKSTTPNVLMAIISLLDDLDQDGLQIIQRQTQRKLKDLLNNQ